MSLLPENVLKNIEMTIAVCRPKFLKISWGSMPPASLEPFLFLNLLRVNSAVKNTLEKMSKFIALVPEKISEYAPDMKVFIGLIYAFFWV